MVKLSVIVPIYNGEEFVEGLVKCLSDQTFLECEYIIVDDGSTDRTAEKLSQVKDERFRIIKGEHKGPSAARNLGIREAKGEYIRFMDADDYICPESNERLMKPISRADYDLVVGNYTYVDPTERYFDGSELREGEVSPKQFALDFLDHMISYYYGVLWNKIYKRAIIIENGILIDESRNWCEDFAFNAEYYRYCNRFYYVNCKSGIYKYIRNPLSITMNLEPMTKEAYEAHKAWQYECVRPFCEKNGVEHELLLADRFNELKYRLQDMYDEFGPSMKACQKEYNREMGQEFAEEYLKKHSMKTSFMYYYLRGWLRARLPKCIRNCRFAKKKGTK